jgi:hypothetical protein
LLRSLTRWRATPVTPECALCLAEPSVREARASSLAGDRVPPAVPTLPGLPTVMVEIGASPGTSDGVYRGLLRALGAFQGTLATGRSDAVAVQTLREVSERRAAGLPSLLLGTDAAHLEDEPALAPVLWRLGFRWLVLRSAIGAAALEAAIAQRFAFVLTAERAADPIAPGASPWIALARTASAITPELARAVAAQGGVVHLTIPDREPEPLESLVARVGEDHLVMAPAQVVAPRLKRLRSRPEAVHKLLGGNLLRVLAVRSGEVRS